MNDAKRAGEAYEWGTLGKNFSSLLRLGGPSLLEICCVGISKISLCVLNRGHSLWRNRE